MKSFKKISVILAATLVVLTGCEKRESKSTFDLPDKDNLIAHGQMLKPNFAPDDMQLLTTPKPSNVSPNIAITKMLQALNSYDSESAFPYNTTYTINRVNEVTIRGKKFYVGLCEFDFKKANGADIKELGGIIPCLGLVDAEDVNKPAIIRTHDAQGVPYRITIHEESFLNGKYDPEQIFKFVDNRGFDNTLSMSEEVSNPNIELDDNLRPYISMMWLEDDAAGGQIGTAYFPKAFILVDLQTEEVTGYSIDNPLTQNVNEGLTQQKNTTKLAKDIPSWVDWVYSKRLFVQMATHYGFPLENYGKRAFKNHLILDGTKVNDAIEVERGFANALETSKSRDGRDLIMTAFYTSRSNDLAVNYILQMNARTGETFMFERKGSEKSMTVKSAVKETLQNAGVMKGKYDVEDITLNPIYGRLTWQAVITRNLHDNEGYDSTQTGSSNSFFSEKDISYSVYAKTCLVEASYDIKISDIVCHDDETTLYTLYRNHLYKKDTKNQRSTILEDKAITGVVKSKMTFGNNVIITLENSEKVFVVTVDNIFDTNIEDALIVEKGDEIHVKYGDQKNLSKSPVRFIDKI